MDTLTLSHQLEIARLVHATFADDFTRWHRHDEWRFGYDDDGDPLHLDPDGSLSAIDNNGTKWPARLGALTPDNPHRVSLPAAVYIHTTRVLRLNFACAVPTAERMASLYARLGSMRVPAFDPFQPQHPRRFIALDQWNHNPTHSYSDLLALTQSVVDHLEARVA